MTTFQNVWPVNELGEIVAAAGVGSSSVTGFVNQDQIPADSNGKVKIAGMAQLVKDEGVARLSDGAVIVPGAAVVVANFSPVVRSSVGGATDTSFVTLATFSVPGGLLGPNGWLEIFFNASSSINTLTKSVSVYVGGNNIAAPTILSNQTSLGWTNYVFNTASELSQKCANIGSSPFGSTATPNINLSVDTRVNFDVAIKVKWSAQAASGGADTITLNGYYIKAHYAP
jgi:hypothetical protein